MGLIIGLIKRLQTKFIIQWIPDGHYENYQNKVKYLMGNNKLDAMHVLHPIHVSSFNLRVYFVFYYTT